ncbi:hypothetical protein M514_07093 [Trichuris suis]|uniref:Transcriptional coactivator p15 (PC4) C-terminal domain-containing protein n=1 Tax=Trichuris suis TaxID=68888 RepID=A0A085M415_9BILA|nr:hypothetical protein M513_07093 [Trichuris suis]KFD71426.1 hypothetical protein M514_07093 [Trichuris suis]KHJ42653.1 transcriptional Coactivator p15 [Trichuris suis]
MSDSSSSGPEDRHVVVKKKKKTTEEPTADDDGRFEIGNKRFVCLNQFRGRTFVDIREYYTTGDGEEKPGKKGISLSVEQFKKFVSLVPKIQDVLRDKYDETL